MSSIDEVELLRRRALAFARYASEAFRNEDYDLACFFAEQALQIRAKSLLLRMLGYVPRTHSIREILGILLKTLEKIERREEALMISGLVERHRDVLRLAEEAYIRSRYGRGGYDRETADAMLRALAEILGVLDNIERALFHE